MTLAFVIIHFTSPGVHGFFLESNRCKTSWTRSGSISQGLKSIQPRPGPHGHPSLINMSIVCVLRFGRGRCYSGGSIHRSSATRPPLPIFCAAYSTFESISLYTTVRSSRILWQYACIAPYNFANSQLNRPFSSTYLT